MRSRLEREVALATLGSPVSDLWRGSWPIRNSRTTKRRKQTERRRQEEPAKARKSADWNKKDHLDPMRASRKPGDDEPKDAEGQADRGHIDQIVTS